MRKHSRKKMLREPVNILGFEPTVQVALHYSDKKPDQTVPTMLYTNEDENMVESQTGNTSFENIKKSLHFRTFQTSGKVGDLLHHQNSDELIVKVMDNQSGTYRVSPQVKNFKPIKVEMKIPLGKDHSPHISETEEVEE